MPSAALPTFAVHAIRYARHDRRASDNFIGGDPHDGPMPLDYFVWVAQGGGRTFLIDTGFDAAAAAARHREYLRCPTDGLRALGIAASEVTDVIITHLHYDHAGNIPLFPNATFHLQDAEMEFATGRLMRHPAIRAAFSVENVVEMVRQVYAERVCFHRGDTELAPGISVHLIGGHTGGLQVVRIWTETGWLVLASDATHLYANMEQGRPFPILLDIGKMLEGFDRLCQLASAPDMIIPGHDPAVMDRFPAPSPALEGVAVRLDGGG